MRDESPGPAHAAHREPHKKVTVPPVNTEPDRDFIRKVYASLSYYMHIPFPEKLDDEVLWEKWEQCRWIRNQEKTS